MKRPHSTKNGRRLRLPAAERKAGGRLTRPLAPDSTAAATPTRAARSHVNDDGSLKRVYATPADAKTAAAEMPGTLVYLCAHRPDHYHIGKPTYRTREKPS